METRSDNDLLYHGQYSELLQALMQHRCPLALWADLIHVIQLLRGTVPDADLDLLLRSALEACDAVIVNACSELLTRENPLERVMLQDIIVVRAVPIDLPLPENDR